MVVLHPFLHGSFFLPKNGSHFEFSNFCQKCKNTNLLLSFEKEEKSDTIICTVILCSMMAGLPSLTPKAVPLVGGRFMVAQPFYEFAFFSFFFAFLFLSEYLCSFSQFFMCVI